MNALSTVLPDVNAHHGDTGAVDDVDLRPVEACMQRLCGDEEIVGRIGAEQLANGGKRVRARLALAAAAALGVDDAVAVGWAAAVELLHNATLIHDDIQDGDQLRRGRPTAWATHGMPQAINAGDLLLMLPALAIDDLAVDATTKQALTAALSTAAIETVRGQGRDLALRAVVDDDDSVVADAYLRCIEGKTGALFALPVEGAALLAGHSRATAKKMARPFQHLGVLFQLQDDVLDLYGDKGREAPGSDIKEGKISALVAEHLRLHPDERSWLMEILDCPRDLTTDDEVGAVVERFVDGGARGAVLDRIVALCTVAVHEAAPALSALVVPLIARVLAPIQHCFGGTHGRG